MGMKVGEFFVSLGIDIDNQDSLKLNDFIKGLGNIDIKAIAATGGLILVGSALKKIMGSALTSGQALFNFGTQTGLSTEKLQKWSFFAEKMGSSASDVESAVKSLSLTAQQINLGLAPGKAGIFRALGVVTGKTVSPFGDPFIVLKNIGEALQGVTPERARMMINMLGISESMLNVFRGLAEEQVNINDEFALTKNQIRDLRELNKEWIGIKQTISQIGLAFGATFSKEISKAIGWIKLFTTEYKTMLQEMNPKKEGKKPVDYISTLFPFLGLLGRAIGKQHEQSLISSGMQGLVPARNGGNVKKEIKLDFNVYGAQDPRGLAIKIMDEAAKRINDVVYQSPKDNI